MWWWWWAWIVFIIVVLLLPLSWGWGRRGWGPPYPTYYRRRYYARPGDRPPIEPEPGDVSPDNPNVPPMRTRTLVDDREPIEPYAGYPWWNWLADLFWLAVLAAIAWAVYLWVT